jgi:hypothetical protein
MTGCARLAVGLYRELRVHRVLYRPGCPSGISQQPDGRAVVSSAESLAFRQRTFSTSGVIWPACHQGCDWNE